MQALRGRVAIALLSLVVMGPVTVAIGQTASAQADDAFFDVPLADLKITAGELPHLNGEADSLRFYNNWIQTVPIPSLNGAGEAYLDATHDSASVVLSASDYSQGRLLIRAPAGKDLSGTLSVPKDHLSGMSLIQFSVPASAATASAREAFYTAKARHYVPLVQQNISGAAWFRHQALDADEKLKQIDPQKHLSASAIPGGVVPIDPDDAYDLFSGGRAISESLQLDRQLLNSPDFGDRSIDVGTLKGITVDKIDWKPLLKDADPKLDALAKLIPADQHMLLFPSFAAAVKLSDESKAGSGELLFKVAQPRSEDAGVLQRYQQQLGLALSDVGRLVGQATIKSVALTGSDPYFPTGTDVAVLFETDHPDMLAALIQAKVAQAAAKQPDVQPQSGEAGGLKYESFCSLDRTICSYIAKLEGAVAVTNSTAQLERLAQVGKKIDAIASLDEYKFFRMRYPLGEKDETAFLFISDPTIRRWCSPQWRIATARRIYVASLLTEWAAAHAVELESKTVEPSKLHPDFAPADIGDVTLADFGINSSTYGTLSSMTPIVELPVDKISRAEADGYNQWREGYENNWRWRFDPIALRISVADNKLAGDLTVMPLILGSEYRDLVNVSRGAKIHPDAGDRHDDLAHLTVALNIKSEQMRGWGNMASAFSPQSHIDMLGWLGSSVALYVDDDRVWNKLRDMQPEDRQKYFDNGGWAQLPIALQAEVSSPFRLAAFLTAIRAIVQQTAPGMTQWESLTYKDQPYVRVKATERARRELGDAPNIALFYAPTPDSLIVSLNEDVLKHALDRRAKREAAGAKGSPGKPGEVSSAGSNSARDTNLADMPWLGESVCFQVDRKLFEVLSRSGVGVLLDADPLTDSAMQRRAWSNIPILNEWKRLFPNEDPVKVHQRLWHTTLICPSGGQYVWNDEWKTMESTVYGHPGQPKNGPNVSAALGQFKSVNFGLTFEEQGLRGRLELNRMHEVEPR